MPTKLIVVRDEIITLTEDIQNPNVDRRYRRDWTKREVLKKGMRLRLRITDETEDYRQIVDRLIAEGADPAYAIHRVSIGVDGRYEKLVFHIHYDGENATGDLSFHTDDDGNLCSEDQLAKTIYETAANTNETNREVIERVIGGYRGTSVIETLMDMGVLNEQHLHDVLAKWQEED